MNDYSESVQLAQKQIDDLEPFIPYVLVVELLEYITALQTKVQTQEKLINAYIKQDATLQARVQKYEKMAVRNDEWLIEKDEEITELEARVQELDEQVIRERGHQKEWADQSIDQAKEITHLNAVLDRIADGEDFCPCPNDSFTNYSEWYTKELAAIKEYARNRGEKDCTHYDEHEVFTGRP